MSETKLIGGQPRAMRVVLSTAKLAPFRHFARYGCRAAERRRMLRAQAGEFARRRTRKSLSTPGTCSRDTNDLAGVVLGVLQWTLRCTCATWQTRSWTGRAEPRDYVLFGTTRAGAHGGCCTRISRRDDYDCEAHRAPTPPTFHGAVLQRVAEMRGVTVPAGCDDYHDAKLRCDGEGQVG